MGTYAIIASVTIGPANQASGAERTFHLVAELDPRILDMMDATWEQVGLHFDVVRSTDGEIVLADQNMAPISTPGGDVTYAHEATVTIPIADALAGTYLVRVFVADDPPTVQPPPVGPNAHPGVVARAVADAFWTTPYQGHIAGDQFAHKLGFFVLT